MTLHTSGKYINFTTPIRHYGPDSHTHIIIYHSGIITLHKKIKIRNPELVPSVLSSV